MIYIVGDSTVSEFNEVYFYKRCGWGCGIGTYFKGLEIKNLAMSGRSSLSFIKETNYQEFLKIKEGDFLFIGFGHNDEKDDDPDRFTSANLDINTKGSFKYTLFNYYIKIAKERKAYPILCTPIVRLDNTNEYVGKNIHITKNGDYRKAIIELAKEVNIDYVDLTSISLEVAKRLGYEKSCLMHAITKGKIDENNNLVPDINSVDPTHINTLGAKYFAYSIAKELSFTNNPIKKYIVNPLIKPTFDDLVMDEGYKFVPYIAPDFDAYKPKEWFDTKSKTYVGTAFGDTGRGTFDRSNGFVAKEFENKFIVGQILKNESEYTPLGKISLNSEGVAIIGRKIPSNKNFTFEACAKIIDCSPIPQAGFGVSLRDDFYLDLKIADKTITSNYVAAGFVSEKDNLVINYSRANSQLVKTDNKIEGEFHNNLEAKFIIKRLGQVVYVTTIYDNVEYKNTFTDFDFTQIDKSNIYISLFATRNTLVEFSEIKFIDEGIAQEA